MLAVAKRQGALPGGQQYTEPLLSEEDGDVAGACPWAAWHTEMQPPHPKQPLGGHWLCGSALLAEGEHQSVLFLPHPPGWPRTRPRCLSLPPTVRALRA